MTYSMIKDQVTTVDEHLENIPDQALVEMSAEA